MPEVLNLEGAVDVLGDMGSMMGGPSLWAVLVLILLAAATAGIIALVVLLGSRRTADRARPTVQPGEEAREILRRPYPAGQLDEDEYLRLSGRAQR